MLKVITLCHAYIRSSTNRLPHPPKDSGRISNNFALSLYAISKMFNILNGGSILKTSNVSTEKSLWDFNPAISVATSASRSIHRLAYILFKNWWTSMLKCARAPSCINHIRFLVNSGTSSSNTGKRFRRKRQYDSAFSLSGRK